MSNELNPDPSAKPEIEVLIIGGGPAGLSAALVLGRARRRVLVCDSGQYRNSVSKALRGFLTRDGTSPEEFRRIAHEEVSRYPSVQFAFSKVQEVEKRPHGFSVLLNDGRRVDTRKLILASGITDRLPEIPGAEKLFGNGLYLCPYCDGWEVQDQPLAIYGKGDAKGAGLALEMTQWSRRLTLCTDGPAKLSSEMKEKLRRFDIEVDERLCTGVEKTETGIKLRFNAGADLDCRAMFFNTSSCSSTDFADRLGCNLIEDKESPDAKRSEHIAGKSCVPGVYIIGDASRDVLQVIVAAGEGSAAAIALNGELLRDDGVL